MFKTPNSLSIYSQVFGNLAWKARNFDANLFISIISLRAHHKLEGKGFFKAVLASFTNIFNISNISTNLYYF